MTLGLRVVRKTKFITRIYLPTYTTYMHTNQTPIVPVEAIGDRHMHTDPESVGKIRWMLDNSERKAPKNGWSSHDGRVLHIAGNMSLLFTLFRRGQERIT